ncbi:retropepsin-like aspartic protease family protein [Sphingomonas rubra]|uniref:Aspartyl protease family protein n=1 Tax=Sphingomonas rubra TaxID=634430 RepID=A0A1I5PWY0_9SPHN|nr:TIGR02281 family clan AA aspartic protease [Sphingomonas rubra]SFP38514.1 aspartyl protease family protein [Sphingomonas rubra]
MLPDLGPQGPLYLAIGAAILAIAIARRIPVLRTLVSIAGWLVLAGLLVVVLGQREAFDPYLGGIAAALKLDGQEVVGGETRIRQSPDGHFWVRVSVGGVTQRMLVDSGATVTALSARTASRMGLRPSEGLVPVLLTTANGTIRAQTVTIPELRLGSIVAHDLSAVASPAFGEVNVIGMNFLSRLKSWRVEGRTLILVPHHPQADAV